MLTRRCITPLKAALDFILPPRCPVSGQLVTQQGTVAADVWAQLQFIRKPFCQCCGNPFAHDIADTELTCGACLRDVPHYAHARSAIRYDDSSAGMILKFKYADKTHLAPLFATWLVQSGDDVLTGADALVPVPLHRWRLLKRRYNQAGLLCAALSAKTNIPTLNFALQRQRRTESQGQKTKAQRLDNIAGAFHVAQPEQIQNKHLVLIDDVLTSGATVNECAKVLLRAGAKRVDVLTLSRVVYAD